MVSTTADGIGSGRSQGRESKRPSSRPASAMSRAEWRIISDRAQAVSGESRRPTRRKPAVQVARGATDSISPSAPSALNARRVCGILPVLGGAAQDQAGDDVGMVADHELGDRAAHRVADHERRADVELLQRGGGVAGAVGQAERRQWPQPAPVAAVVDGQDPVAGARRDRRRRRTS